MQDKINKQETLEEAIEKYADVYRCPATNDEEYCRHDIISAIIFGAKWQAERMYSEEDTNEYADYVLMCSAEKTLKIPLHPRQWLEQFKKK